MSAAGLACVRNNANICAQWGSEPMGGDGMTEQTEKIGLPAAYAATAQMLMNQDQVIWQRAGNIMLFNGVLTATVLAVVQFGLKATPSFWAIQGLAVVGGYYAVFYIVSFL